MCIWVFDEILIVNSGLNQRYCRNCSKNPDSWKCEPCLKIWLFFSVTFLSYNSKNHLNKNYLLIPFLESSCNSKITYFKYFSRSECLLDSPIYVAKKLAMSVFFSSENKPLGIGVTCIPLYIRKTFFPRRSRLSKLTSQLQTYLNNKDKIWTDEINDLWIELFGSPNAYCFPGMSFNSDTLNLTPKLTIQVKTVAVSLHSSLLLAIGYAWNPQIIHLKRTDFLVHFNFTVKLQMQSNF